MRLSELAGRELVDMENGEKIGQLGHADLWIDAKTGRIGYLILPADTRFFSFGKKHEEQSVPWESIHKIGTDTILLDLKRGKFTEKERNSGV
ncbi:YlmC/YmxH family sporulation protein [Effusibacillus consociatus]|uniref:YlmC/YmxH family sporulation protein n=1 Tax=Effusibacillus consociatus TaxID=1117041 RepID=A0ABV9Q6F5_9BACL